MCRLSYILLAISMLTETLSQSIPVVTVDQAQYFVITGQTVTLGCSVSATPGHTSVIWRRTLNGVTNDVAIDGSKYQGATVNNPSLTIRNAAASDQAVYTCSATNIVGTGTSTTTTLTVTGSIPIVTITNNSYSVVTGQTVTLGCIVSATPTHTYVFWQRIDNVVTTTLTIDGTKYSGSTVNTPSLTITSANSNDNTVYTCSATNAVGTGTSRLTTLTVTGRTTITLQCTVSSTTTITNVLWRRLINGVTSTITIDNVNYSGGSTSTPSLTIITTSPSDTGTYTCLGSNSAGTGSATTQLTVTGGVSAMFVDYACF